MPRVQAVCISGINPWSHTALRVSTTRCTIQVDPRGVAWSLWVPMQKLTWAPNTTIRRFHHAPPRKGIQNLFDLKENSSKQALTVQTFVYRKWICWLPWETALFGVLVNKSVYVCIENNACTFSFFSLLPASCTALLLKVMERKERFFPQQFRN